MENPDRPAKCTSQEGANQSSSQKRTSFFTSDVCSGLGGVGRFKMKIVKKSPTAQEIIDDNFPRKTALAEGFGTAWDIWSEDMDRKRRMGI